MNKTPTTMLRVLRVIALVALIAVLPSYAHAIDLRESSGIRFGATIFSACNLILFITAISCIKQYFWPGDNNTMPFQIFNSIFAVLFYASGLPFLINNKQYYEGYSSLAPISVIGKFFFSIDISSFAQWVIVASVLINILYVTKYRREYYQAGIAQGAESANVMPVAGDMAMITDEPDPSLATATTADTDPGVQEEFTI